MSFPDPAEPDQAYVEGQAGEHYIEGSEQVARYLENGGHAVRNSRDRDHVQIYGTIEWTAFLDAIRWGQFDR